MKYTQLDKNERFLIQKLYNEENKNITQISKILGRNKSTISREIKRNSTADGYNFEITERKYIKRSKHKYMFFLNKYDEFIKVFFEKFKKKYHGVAVTYNWIEKTIQISKNLRYGKFIIELKTNAGISHLHLD